MKFVPQPGTTVIEGATRSGKTALAVEWALLFLSLGIPVISNFPIVDWKTGHRSREFIPQYRHLLQDCIVVLDEAWGLGLSSSDSRNVDKKDEDFFRFAGQNGLIIIVISQSTAVKVVRDCAQWFCKTSAVHLPAKNKKPKDGKAELNTGMPLIFKRYFRQKYESAVPLFTQKKWFPILSNRYTYTCYNHRSFRRSNPVSYEEFPLCDFSIVKPFVPLKRILSLVNLVTWVWKDTFRGICVFLFLIYVIFCCFVTDWSGAVCGSALGLSLVFAIVLCDLIKIVIGVVISHERDKRRNRTPV